VLTLTQPECCSVSLHVVKGRFPSPLTLEGFLAREASMVKALSKSTKGFGRKLLKALLALLDDQGLGTVIGQSRLTENALKALRVYRNQVMGAAPQIAAENQAKIANESVKAGARTWFKTKKHLVKKNVRPETLWEAEFFGRHNELFMGKFFDETLAQRAKDKIIDAHAEASRRHSGISDTLERYAAIRADVAAQLKQDFAGIAGASEGYWKTYSANALNNARTYAQLQMFQQQDGVIGYRIRAVMDSQTTDICRSLNGMTFSIPQALERFEQMFAAQSIPDFQAIHPMVRGDAQGGYSFDRLSSTVSVNINSRAFLQNNGICFPPFHWGCRSSVEPVYGMLDWDLLETRSIEHDADQSAGLPAEMIQLTDEDLDHLRRMELATNAEDFYRAAAGFRPFEVAFIETRGGQYFMHTSYRSGWVDYTPQQMSLMAGATLVHTHPEDRTLSSDDIGVGITSGADRIIAASATGNNGRAYIMSGLQDFDWGFNSSSLTDQLDAMRIGGNLSVLRQQLDDMIDEGRLTQYLAGSIYMHYSNQRIARILGVTYGVIEFNTDGP